MSKKIARVSFLSEYDHPLYFDEDGNRIADTSEPKAYKPMYDFETKSIKHWWFKNESTLYFDIHTEIARFRSRTTIGKYWKALRIVIVHKYIGRFL